MIDLHHHALAGIDDGPPDVAASVALLGAAAAAGTRTVVATPHVSWRWPDNDALHIAEEVLLLRRALAEAGIDLELRRGAEVALTRAVDLAADELRRLRLGGAGWLLVECPHEASEMAIQSGIEQLQAAGHRVLLAHPERIPAFRDAPRLLAGLVARGARCQLTASALVGRFGREIERFSRELMEEGLIHVIASDAHGLTGRPPAVLSVLQEARIPDPLAKLLTQDTAAAFLAGADVPARAPELAAPVRRSLRRR